MNIKELNYFYNKFKFGEDIFHTLMQKKVRNILLVSTFYDAFVFEQDGRLSEQIFGEYHQLHLTRAPKITSVPTAKEALRKIEKIRFDMVITMMRIGDITPFELSKKIKEKYPNLPVLLLLNIQSDIALISNNIHEMEHIDNVFLWKGDPKIFLAMIKYIEDLKNVEHDTAIGLVQVILLVEDSIYFYSRFLPELYKEIMLQTQLLISEELSDMQKNYRMRTRPKVLLAHTFEDAIQICKKYKEYLLCVISDIRYVRNGKLDSKAGLRLVEQLRSENYDMPVLLQSSNNRFAKDAEKLKTYFINKNSDSLLSNLSEFIHSHLGFGDFVFRDEEGKEIDRARTMVDFEKKLHEISAESLLYHSKKDHFYSWLIAHGEIQIAKKIKPLTVEYFETIEDLRHYLINVCKEISDQKNKGKIIDFKPQNLDTENKIVRLCEGSLGGKGRGIAFLNALLATMEFEDKFDGVKVKIPNTALIGAQEFDLFLGKNKLRTKIFASNIPDEEIKKLFLAGSLSTELRKKLSIYLENIKTPITVRSSGLLEDSQSQPFAGVYQTFMLPNNNPDKKVRQTQMEDAIKLVFASTFLKNAKNYLKCLQYKTEEEKMAVIIQKVVGESYNGYFYPLFSGVAQSYNYYPTSYMKNNDGVANLALGLGQWVVGGRKLYRFCPKYPELQILKPEDFLISSQTEFYALNMKNYDFDLTYGESATFSILDLKMADKDEILQHICSTWDPADSRIRDGLHHAGIPVITFANILKYRSFPLSDILTELLEIGEKALGIPVEIEFAVSLKKDISGKKIPTFYILQIRPLLIYSEEVLMTTGKINKEELFLYTENGMGNGIISDICDIVYIDPEKFDNTKTIEMIKEIQQINTHMISDDREYILIGPGRWGSRDRFLGVPVRWADINKARVIVETGLKDFLVEASQGTHFFHNLVAMNAGYFTISYNSKRDFIDWKWLKSQKHFNKTKYFVHIRNKEPFIIKMFGKDGISVIYQ